MKLKNFGIAMAGLSKPQELAEREEREEAACPEERRKTAANALKMHPKWKRKNDLALTGGRESHDSTCLSA